MKDKKPLGIWLEDHRLQFELGYSAKDIGDMDVEKRIFHLSIFYAQDMNRLVLEAKRKKEAKRLKSKMSGMRRRR